MDDSLILAELRALRTDQATAHLELSNKLVAGFTAVAETISAHELDDAKMFARVSERIAPLEAMRGYVKWVLMTGGAVGVVAGAKALFHL